MPRMKRKAATHAQTQMQVAEETETEEREEDEEMISEYTSLQLAIASGD